MNGHNNGLIDSEEALVRALVEQVSNFEADTACYKCGEILSAEPAAFKASLSPIGRLEIRPVCRACFFKHDSEKE